MDLRSVVKQNRKKAIGEYLREAWYFEKAYEKLILIGLCALGLWKLGGFFV